TKENLEINIELEELRKKCEEQQKLNTRLKKSNNTQMVEIRKLKEELMIREQDIQAAKKDIEELKQSHLNEMNKLKEDYEREISQLHEQLKNDKTKEKKIKDYDKLLTKYQDIEKKYRQNTIDSSNLQR